MIPDRRFATCQEFFFTMTAIEQIKSRLHEYLPKLKQKYPIEKLGIFGSATRNDFTDQSDVDILVTFNGEVGFEFFELAEELQKVLGRKVDLVSEGAIKPHYWPYIKKDLIYV